MIHLLVHLLLLALRESESTPRKPLSAPVREFGPRILSAETVRQFPLGFAKCYLLSQVIAEGTKRYQHILAVHDLEGAPWLLISAESDLAAENSGALSLGVYAPGGYQNLGPSADLEDIWLFQDVAVEVARSRLGISG